MQTPVRLTWRVRLRDSVAASGQFTNLVIAALLLALKVVLGGVGIYVTPESRITFGFLATALTALLSSYVLQKMQQKSNPAAAQVQGSMKTMLYIMPLFSVYLGFILPSALAVYWITNNLFTMAQETFLTWYLDKYHPIEVDDPKKKNKKLPKGDA